MKGRSGVKKIEGKGLGQCTFISRGVTGAFSEQGCYVVF